LRAFSTLGHGQALLAAGDVAGATKRFDEVMVSVTAGEVGPIARGIVYCAVILECVQIYDFERASEWTDALGRWCDSQPDLVPFRGQCLVHRSQLQQAAGDWPSAVATAEAACVRLADPPHPALGLANYQQAELHRLRGEFDRGEAAYRAASRHGHQPMPGLALLELARGDAPAAASSIGGALEQPHDRKLRPALLAAAVEIRRAAGDLPGARSAAKELVALTDGVSSPAMRALAEQAMGSVLTAEGDTRAGAEQLRAALGTWQRLRMPYEAARASVLLGLACAATGDRTSAALHFDNAGQTFAELGAEPDLERLRSLTSGLVGRPVSGSEQAAAAGLSRREVEVLAHVMAGKTNREIAGELTISQHTVGRHLENIFNKLGVTTRAAATAWAYEHDLAGDRLRT
jgi:DNA-binding CsgD family transcriptional regulator